MPDKRFKIVHCAGYLKAWVPSSGDVETEADEEGCNLSCLVSATAALSERQWNGCYLLNF